MERLKEPHTFMYYMLALIAVVISLVSTPFSHLGVLQLLCPRGPVMNKDV